MEDSAAHALSCVLLKDKQIQIAEKSTVSGKPYRLVSYNQSPNLKSQILISCSVRIIFKLARGQNGTHLDPSTFEAQYYFLWGTNISTMT